MSLTRRGGGPGPRRVGSLLVSWGLFTRDGAFVPVDAAPDPETLARLFRHKVLRMLLDEGAIDQAVVANLLAWPHSGFGAHVSREIPADHGTPEIVARYMTRAPIVGDVATFVT